MQSVENCLPKVPQALRQAPAAFYCSGFFCVFSSASMSSAPNGRVRSSSTPRAFERGEVAGCTTAAPLSARPPRSTEMTEPRDTAEIQHAVVALPANAVGVVAEGSVVDDPSRRSVSRCEAGSGVPRMGKRVLGHWATTLNLGWPSNPLPLLLIGLGAWGGGRTWSPPP